MITLSIDRGFDFAQRLGDLLQTQGQFTIILLPEEFRDNLSTCSIPLKRGTEIKIICREYQGMVVVESLKIRAIKDITLDELRSCLGPQNEKALLNILRGKAGSLNRDSMIILLHVRANPAQVLK